MQQSRDFEWGILPQRRGLITRGLIETDLVGWCLRCRLRLGDTPTMGRTSVKDSDGGYSYQWRISTARRLSERGACRLLLLLSSPSGDTPTTGCASVLKSGGDAPIIGVARKWLGAKMHLYFMI